MKDEPDRRKTKRRDEPERRKKDGEMCGAAEQSLMTQGRRDRGGG